MRGQSVKKRIFDVIQIGNRDDMPSLIFDFVIVFMIIVNIAITFMQTFDEFHAYAHLFSSIELITMIVFMLEYCLRIWTASYLYKDKNVRQAQIKFIFSFYGIIDLLTFLPYFLPFFLPSGVVAFRMFRVVRILRLFRINANYDAFNVITDVLKDKRDQIISSIFLVFVLMMASSLCMYGLEHEAQPDKFANAFSGIWWSVSTLLTVGYGDIYPVTVGGRIMAIVIAFLGVGMVAIPTGIISAGFVEYFSKVKVGSYMKHEEDFVTLEVTKNHPYCGKLIKDIDLVKGLYLAAILREDNVCFPTDDLCVKSGDLLLIGTVSYSRIDATVEDIVLVAGHPWIEQPIKNLDLSRREYIVMVKRKNKIIAPRGMTILKEGDNILILRK